nr:hypothetical protein DA06_07925 [Georgenia sp. SUBG003]
MTVTSPSGTASSAAASAPAGPATGSVVTSSGGTQPRRTGIIAPALGPWVTLRAVTTRTASSPSTARPGT